MQSNTAFSYVAAVDPRRRIYRRTAYLILTEQILIQRLLEP